MKFPPNHPAPLEAEVPMLFEYDADTLKLLPDVFPLTLAEPPADVDPLTNTKPVPGPTKLRLPAAAPQASVFAPTVPGTVIDPRPRRSLRSRLRSR